MSLSETNSDTTISYRGTRIVGNRNTHNINMAFEIMRTSSTVLKLYVLYCRPGSAPDENEIYRLKFKTRINKTKLNAYIHV